MKRRKYRLMLSLIVLMCINSCKTAAPVAGGPESPSDGGVPTSEEVVVSQVDTIPEPQEITEPVSEVIPDKGKKKRRIAHDPHTPEAMREFRAAWVATVANINWPSKPGLSSEQQQKEAIALLDLLKEHNFNAVILQVRPQADALYESQLEPWSYFLTGKQGKAPEPFYDPLHFWTEAAHDRGLELHAWLNPYRAQHTSGGEISDKSVIRTKPELVVKLKNGMYWMDPSRKGTQEHATAVVMDILKRYDVDGIHFDDYFYPYDSYNNGEDFPDDKSWSAYQLDGGELSRGDWRRQSVNIFIKNLYEKIKAEKPHVKFGISPFGIWRPGFPESIRGYDQYDKLYADARLWLNEAWIDYFTPQLYWSINQQPQSFPVLLGWWEEQNDKERHLWPGLNIGLGGDEKNVDEVINQIMITRGMLPESPGAVHWSIAPLVKHPSLAKAILEGPYKREALVPASPWLDHEAPAAPVVVLEIENGTVNITWVPGDDEEPFKQVVYYNYGSSWNYKIVDRNANSLLLQKVVTGPDGKKSSLIKVGVTAVDRSGNESLFKEVKL